MFSQGSPPPRTGQDVESCLGGADALAFAQRRYGALSADGTRVYPGAKPQDIDPDQVETAMRFLKNLQQTKRPTIGSGTLKHHAEDWGREYGLCAYVSRGAVTAAAVALDYSVSPCAIGVSKKDLSRLMSDVRDLRRKRLAAGK